MPQSGITIKKLPATHLEAAVQSIATSKQHCPKFIDACSAL